VKEVIVYTDGGCWNGKRSNPGGWASILQYKNVVKELSGFEPRTTNNRMELTAAIMSLKKLEEPCSVTLHTDSKYVKKGITEWINTWQHNGWQTSARQPVKNKELWVELNTLSKVHKIKWKWVPGHSGQRQNERCDVLVQQAIKENKDNW